MSPSQSIYIPVDQLQIGLYVDLELFWTEHPFLFRKFKIKNISEIKQIANLGLKEVKVISNKSSAKALRSVTNKSSSTTENINVANIAVKMDVDVDEALAEMWNEKKQSLDKARKFRRERVKTEQQYRETLKRVNQLIRDLKSAPANAVQNATEVIEDICALLQDEPDMVVSLVSLTTDEFTSTSHALNVTVLTMALAKSLGMPTEDIRKIGLASILHDIGKVFLQTDITQKKTPLTEAEQKVMQTHVEKGVLLLSKLNIVSEEVINIVSQHHIFMDGTGFPEMYKGTELTDLTRILQIANIYDDLCNPKYTGESMSPKTAMAILFSNFNGRLDNNYVHLFVRNFGVYPPGTIVSLSDDSVALVSSVDSNDLLNPTVIIFNPDIPAKQALMLNLSDHPELTVVKALNRNEYSKEVQDYLGGDFKIGLFINQSGSKE